MDPVLLANYARLNDLLDEYGLSCVTLGEAQKMGLSCDSNKDDILGIVGAVVSQLDADISAMKAEGTWF